MAHKSCSNCGGKTGDAGAEKDKEELCSFCIEFGSGDPDKLSKIKEFARGRFMEGHLEGCLHID